MVILVSDTGIADEFVDNLQHVDHMGPVTRLTFSVTMPALDPPHEVERRVAVRLIIPTEKLHQIARELLVEAEQKEDETEPSPGMPPNGVH
jgi:hypothetical protein